VSYIENCGKISHRERIKDLLEKELYNKIKDLPQTKKYHFLKEWINIKNIEFDSFSSLKIKKIFDDVFSFFNNRSKWRNLIRARDEIIILNSNIKIENTVKDENNSKFCEFSANDTQDMNVQIYYNL